MKVGVHSVAPPMFALVDFVVALNAFVRWYFFHSFVCWLRDYRNDYDPAGETKLSTTLPLPTQRFWPSCQPVP